MKRKRKCGKRRIQFRLIYREEHKFLKERNFMIYIPIGRDKGDN